MFVWYTTIDEIKKRKREISLRTRQNMFGRLQNVKTKEENRESSSQCRKHVVSTPQFMK